MFLSNLTHFLVNTNAKSHYEQQWLSGFENLSTSIYISSLFEMYLAYI